MQAHRGPAPPAGPAQPSRPECTGAPAVGPLQPVAAVSMDGGVSIAASSSLTGGRSVSSGPVTVGDAVFFSGWLVDETRPLRLCVCLHMLRFEHVVQLVIVFGST